MEIISKSNQGFRTRPSFQKVANMPNKEINYVVNPIQAVRDSYAFSNSINGDVDVEDEINILSLMKSSTMKLKRKYHAVKT